jgi:hypothetical protein
MKNRKRNEKRDVSYFITYKKKKQSVNIYAELVEVPTNKKKVHVLDSFFGLFSASSLNVR